jgi:hypothetical protein
MAKGRPTTPKRMGRFSSSVLAICQRLNATAQPVFLPYTNVWDGYIAGNCHTNVAHRVREHGGARLNGWMIWELPGVFSEGEFHCVWKSPDGQLIDVTPRGDGEARILFLPDPATRLTHGPNGGIMQLANRTTRPEVPYTMYGQPSDPTAEYFWDAPSRAHAVRLGYPDPRVLFDPDTRDS